jgi:hypothetical protein
VIANGVTIKDGAKFAFRPRGDSALTLGQVFTVIDNTAAAPIAGTFHNLKEGKTITVNGSELQASYTGGDGNDLTLTVVPFSGQRVNFAPSQARSTFVRALLGTTAPDSAPNGASQAARFD